MKKSKAHLLAESVAPRGATITQAWQGNRPSETLAETTLGVTLLISYRTIIGVRLPSGQRYALPLGTHSPTTDRTQRDNGYYGAACVVMDSEEFNQMLKNLFA